MVWGEREETDLDIYGLKGGSLAVRRQRVLFLILTQEGGFLLEITQQPSVSAQTGNLGIKGRVQEGGSLLLSTAWAGRRPWERGFSKTMPSLISEALNAPAEHFSMDSDDRKRNNMWVSSILSVYLCKTCKWTNPNLTYYGRRKVNSLVLTRISNTQVCLMLLLLSF